MSAVRTAIGSKCASEFLDVMFTCLSDPRSKQAITFVLKVLAAHIENVDWKQPVESDFTLIDTVARLASVDWILHDSATLFSVCKWICQVFCLTCRLPSRPVRVDRLIEILCNLAASTETKFQAAASTMAVKLSFDRFFRLGLINYNHGFGLSVLIVPLLRPPQSKTDIIASSLSRLQNALDLLEQIANSSEDSRNLIDQMTCPYVGKWLQALYDLSTRNFAHDTRNTLKRIRTEYSRRSTEYPGCPLQHLPLTDTLNHVLRFLKRLVCSGSTKCLCTDSKNLSVIVRIALAWLIPSKTDAMETTLPGGKRPNDKGSLRPPDGESATALLLAAARNVDVCRSLLSPGEGYLKQLLLLGCFACTSTHISDNQRLAAMELLRTLACMSSDWNFSILGANNPDGDRVDPLHVTNWEQLLVHRAFSLAFLDLPAEVTSAMRKRLFRPCDHLAPMAHTCRPTSSCINHLVSLARRFATSFFIPRASWSQPVWLSFTGLISKLTSPNLTVAWTPSNLFSSQQSFDRVLLDALISCVLPTESMPDSNRASRLYARTQLLIEHVFGAVNGQYSDDCAYKAWLGGRSENDQIHPNFYISLQFSGAQRQEYDIYMHLYASALIVEPAQNDCDFVQLPVQASILCGISPFFEVLFSRRWSLNVAEVGGVVTLSDKSGKPNCVHWPLLAFLVIMHLAFGCEWKSCSFLRAFLLLSATERTTPAEHVAELLGLADRLLLLLEVNPDSPSSIVAPPGSSFLFRFQRYLLCSLVYTVSLLAIQEKPDSSVIRNLFITCLSLSAHFYDISLFTAIVWLAFSDSHWMPSEASINARRNLLKRPIAYCLYALLQFRPFWGQDDEPNLCSSMASSLDKLLLKLLRSP